MQFVDEAFMGDLIEGLCNPLLEDGDYMGHLPEINDSWRGTRRLEDGPCNPHLQEGRQEQVLKLQACVTDIDMLQTYGTHTSQQSLVQSLYMV
jgi:hypothetical protein